MKRILIFSMVAAVLVLAALACNLPGSVDTEATETAEANVFNAAATAAMESTQALPPTPSETPTEAGTPTETPTVTPTIILKPFLTANVNSNVRAGPGTVYDIHGNLLQGQTADIVGRNSNSSWWVIAFAPAPSGRGWIANSIVTVSGDVTNIPIVAAPPTPTPSPTGDWHGTWVTNCGSDDCDEMQLVQNGDNVTGTYASGDGSLSGVVTDNRLTGTWSRGSGSGTFDFWLTGSEKQWRGNWDKNNSWCGHRQGESDPSPCGVASWYGSWTTDCGPSNCGTMTFTQDGVNIEASYAGGLGTISGTVSGTEITGTWFRGGSNGPMKFYMLSNEDRFNGNFGGVNAWCGHRNGAGMPGTCLAP